MRKAFSGWRVFDFREFDQVQGIDFKQALLLEIEKRKSLSEERCRATVRGLDTKLQILYISPGLSSTASFLQLVQ